MKRRINKQGGAEGGFGEQTKKAFSYLRDSRNYVYAIALIFLAGAILGFVFPEKFAFLDELLKELIGKIEGLDFWGVFLFIFQNNLRSALIGMVFGVLLGIFPVFNAVSNGVVLGYVMRGVWAESGFGSLWRILPHGIFEIPAVFISLALGLKLGMFVFADRKKPMGRELFERARNAFIIFVFLVIPLLILAALIESGLIVMLR